MSLATLLPETLDDWAVRSRLCVSLLTRIPEPIGEHWKLYVGGGMFIHHRNGTGPTVADVERS